MKSDEDLVSLAPDQDLVPEGVDLSEPIKEIDLEDLSLITSTEDLLNITVQRIVNLDEDDPIYTAIAADLVEKAKHKWYKKGDYEIFKLYVRNYPGQVYKHFEDLRELRLDLLRKRRKKLRRKRGRK
ncbi:MAG: hypothetical protein DRQ40_04675 [Gammaproteobacteria bacterium]|nr:MAG: hypothetical protein DRQ40_04675 [Gammaproteobacteria bacterium]